MTWQTYLNQASQLVSEARYVEAEQIIYQAFTEARQQNDLEKTYTALDLLGYLAFVQQKYQESDQIYRYSAQVKIQVLGKDHIEIGKTLKNLISAAYHQQQYQQVIVYAYEALRIFAYNYGTACQECQQLAGNLIELLKWMQKLPEAEQVRVYYMEQNHPPQIQQAQQQPVQQQPVQQQPVQQQPVQQQAVQQQPVQQQPVQQQAVQQQPVQQQPVQQQPVQQQPVQQQAVQQQPVQQQQVSQQQQYYLQQVAQQQQQPAQQQPAQQQQSAQQRKRRDYSNYAKSICEVCQMPFEGSECLRCTSGQIAVFDPSSKLNNDFG